MIRVEEALKKAKQVREKLEEEKRLKEEAEYKKLLEERKKDILNIKECGEELIKDLIEGGIDKGGEGESSVVVSKGSITEIEVEEIENYFKSYGYKCKISPYNTYSYSQNNPEYYVNIKIGF